MSKYNHLKFLKKTKHYFFPQFAFAKINERGNKSLNNQT